MRRFCGHHVERVREILVHRGGRVPHVTFEEFPEPRRGLQYPSGAASPAGAARKLKTGSRHRRIAGRPSADHRRFSICRRHESPSAAAISRRSQTEGYQSDHAEQPGHQHRPIGICAKLAIVLVVLVY